MCDVAVGGKQGVITDKSSVFIGLLALIQFQFDDGAVWVIRFPYNAICPTLSPLFSVARRPTFAFPRLSLRFRQRPEQVKVSLRFATRWSFLRGLRHSMHRCSANSSAVSGSSTRSRARFGCRLLHVLMSIDPPLSPPRVLRRTRLACSKGCRLLPVAVGHCRCRCPPPRPRP